MLLLPLLGLLLLLSPSSYAQVLSGGRCPTVSVVEDFNATEYLGKWYEQERYFNIFETGGDCVTAVYGDEGDGVISVKNTMTNTLLRKTQTVSGTAKMAASDSAGRLLVSIPNGSPFEAPYWILDTDYQSYSVVWGCSDLASLMNAQFAWLLTREKTPSEELLQQMRAVLEENHVSTKRLQKTRQTCDN